LKLTIEVNVPGEKHPYIGARVVLAECLNAIAQAEVEHKGCVVNLHRNDGSECGRMVFYAENQSEPGGS